MENVSIFKYYSFGFNYYLILRDGSNRTNSGYFHWLNKYLEEIEGLNMPVTKSAIALKEFMNDFNKLKKLATGSKTKDENLSKDLHDSIRRKLEEIDHVLDAELQHKRAFVLSEKRISNDILIGKIHKLFPKDYFLALSSIAQYDLNESGYCLAFNRYTASAFHSLRATEEVLKMYFEKLTGKKATEKDTWNVFVTSIQSEVKSGLTPEPSEELLINLDSLRKYYRNKTQHPQLIYTSDEVQDLIPFCVKTISQIITDLKKRGLA